MRDEDRSSAYCTNSFQVDLIIIYSYDMYRLLLTVTGCLTYLIVVFTTHQTRQANTEHRNKNCDFVCLVCSMQQLQELVHMDFIAIVILVALICFVGGVALRAYVTSRRAARELSTLTNQSISLMSITACQLDI